MERFSDGVKSVDTGKNDMQSALVLSEEKYRTAFEYTGTAMLVAEADGTVVMANHKLEEVTGYSLEDVAKGPKWYNFVSDHDLPRMLESNAKRYKDPGSVPNEYEFSLKQKNGQLRDMLLNVSIIPGTKKLLISLIDITARKKMEKILSESEKKYRDLFENANDIIYVHDLDGYFTTSNAAALNTYGYTPGEVSGMHISNIVDPAYIQIAKEHLIENVKVRLKSEPYQLLTYKKNGEPVWIEARTRLVLQDGKGIGIQGIARDITERKKMDEQLIESQRRFKEMADLLPSIIVELNTDLMCTYVNKIGMTKFGFTEEDVRKGLKLEDAFPAYEMARVKQNIGALLAGNPSKLEEYVMVHQDGTQGHYYITSSLIQREGRVTGLRSCIVDISDKKRMEQQLRRSEEQLRSIYTASPIGIALFDEEGKFIDANRSFRDMFGLPETVEYAAVHFSLFKNLAPAKEKRDILEKGKGISFECADDFKFAQSNQRYQCIAAGNRYLEWHITPLGIKNEEKRVFLAQVQDITEKKRAEEAKLSKAQKATYEANKMIEGLRKEIFELSQFQNMISRSPAMQDIFAVLPEIAQAATTVLITGESGTGKELIARSIHQLSPRKNKPFIAINCGALPDNLLESELFGYKAGAFTDAKKDKPGKFALADGGTIFLDEIGDITPAMQVRLLRVLQERIFEPLGGIEPVSVDIRVVVATNKNLPDLIKNGLFREDLYYRIKVLKINLPPLRERKCDIPLLCDYFISLYNSRFKKNIREVSGKALDVLLSHEYPGNIRELENILEHAFIFCKSSVIEPGHLPSEIVCGKISAGKTENIFDRVQTFEELEKLFLTHVINQAGGSKIKAAEKLGMHKATLFRKIKSLGIEGE